MYNNVSGMEVLGGLGAMIIGFAVIFLIFGLAFVVMNVIGQWKVLKKAGDEGWKALIPFYNTYSLCKISGVNPWWILIAVVAGLFSNVHEIFGVLSSAIGIYFSIILGLSIAKSFGKETGFGIGIAFLGSIFYLILGCGSSEYVGCRPSNDPVMGLFNKDNNSNNNFNNTKATSNNVAQNNSSNETEVLSSKKNFCPRCGHQLAEGTRFCPGCGKEI